MYKRVIQYTLIAVTWIDNSRVPDLVDFSTAPSNDATNELVGDDHLTALSAGRLLLLDGHTKQVVVEWSTHVGQVVVHRSHLL